MQLEPQMLIGIGSASPTLLAGGFGEHHTSRLRETTFLETIK